MRGEGWDLICTSTAGQLQAMEKRGILLHLLRYHSRNVSPKSCRHPRTGQSSVHGCAS